jgi:hypothetical protein
MVLKGVRGKILKHGSYVGSRESRFPFWDCADGSGSASVVRLSKTDDYLVDNVYGSMLSEVMGGLQEESE